MSSLKIKSGIKKISLLNEEDVEVGVAKIDVEDKQVLAKLIDILTFVNADSKELEKLTKVDWMEEDVTSDNLDAFLNSVNTLNLNNILSLNEEMVDKLKVKIDEIFGEGICEIIEGLAGKSTDTYIDLLNMGMDLMAVKSESNINKYTQS